LAGLKEFVNRDGHIVVPDTSALVRGIWFEDFDWPTELGLTPVRIVIPILVIEELDLLKDRERTTKAGDRARRVVRRLRDLCGAVPPGHPANLPTCQPEPMSPSRSSSTMTGIRGARTTTGRSLSKHGWSRP